MCSICNKCDPLAKAWYSEMESPDRSKDGLKETGKRPHSDWEERDQEHEAPNDQTVSQQEVAYSYRQEEPLYSKQQEPLVPGGPAPAIVRAANPWSARRGEMSEKEKVLRTVNRVLDKLTPQKFEFLLDQLLHLGIHSVEILMEVAFLVFDKAVSMPSLCPMYAKLCLHLSKVLPEFEEDGKPITFRRILLNSCQEAFESADSMRAEIQKMTKPKEVERSELEKLVKLQALGNIRLIAELFKLKMITERVVHCCIRKLLGPDSTVTPVEENLELLCELFATCGKQLDESPKSLRANDDYFFALKRFTKNQCLPVRVRFMIQNTIYMRTNNWVPRGEEVKAKTIISEILKGVISLIFDKAIFEPMFCSMYAELCMHLSRVFPEFPSDEDNRKPITFHRILVNSCQKEFEVADRMRAEIQKMTKPEEEVDRFEKQQLLKLCTLGNIGLIGELFKLKIIPEKIVHHCIRMLLGPNPRTSPAEENLEALCQLFVMAGKQLDESPKSLKANDHYFSQLKGFTKNQRLSAHVRSMIQDTINMRVNKWVPRRERVKAKTIKEIVSLVVDKAVLEPTICQMYAELCLHLSKALPEFLSDEDNGKPITFRRILLNSCQEEFEAVDSMQAEIEKMTKPEEVVERIEKEKLVKLRTFGYVRLIGELFKLEMIQEKIVHHCIHMLLGPDPKATPAEENLEVLCLLFGMIGKQLDENGKSLEANNVYFSRLKGFTNNKKLSPRIRFMIQNTANMRTNKWVSRCEEVKAKTINEILKGFISLVFDKAVLESTFCPLYAQFCVNLSKVFPEFPSDEDNGKPIAFHQILLNRCQEEFDGADSMWAEIQERTKPEELERFQKEKLVKLRTLGNIRLIGELFKLNMIPEKFVHHCIQMLLGPDPRATPAEENLEALCQLFATGLNESPKFLKLNDVYLSQLKGFTKNQGLSARTRFMIQNTIDMCTNKWAARHKEVKAKTINEILKGIMSLVFDKAILEPTFCPMYAELCVHLSKAFPEFPLVEDDGKTITFCQFLLNSCQEEFEGVDKMRAEIQKMTKPEEVECFEEMVKLRTLGNIRLIGELFKLKMIPEKIMHYCIQTLLGPDPKAAPTEMEEDLEALCQLFALGGKALVDENQVSLKSNDVSA